MFSRLKALTMLPAARTIIGAQSLASRLQSVGKTPDVLIETPYQGQPVLLLALYQKGVIRPDVMRMLRAARDKGLYVLAVNTLRLRDPQELQGLVDCYIERPNFGRDFGSYKTGFRHLYRQAWDRHCPRLLLVNDSVFFSSSRLAVFLDEMMNSSFSVLGATENYEGSYHLGSFCIAMSGDILRHGRMRKFWRNYRLSDVRRVVIARGEVGLTQALRRCLRAPGDMAPLYGSARFAGELCKDADLLEFAVANARRSDRVHWRRATADMLADHLLASLTIARHEADGANAHIEARIDEIGAREWVSSYKDVVRLVRSRVTDPDLVDDAAIHAASAAFMTEAFMVGSQIHQNGAILLRMGLPIIKLDGLYRGVFNISDINVICGLLGQDEAEELRGILMQRPFGENVLRGWRLTAFKWGYL